MGVRFFCQDVHDVWLRWSEGADGKIPNDTEVLLDLKQITENSEAVEILPSTHVKGNRKREAVGKGGVEGVDIGYSHLRGHLEKSALLLAENETNVCVVCSKAIKTQKTIALVCPRTTCKAASHMSCLAHRFLQEEKQDVSIIPTSGACPSCGSKLHWIELVKELSLRAKDEKEVARLMKKPKACAAKDSVSKKAPSSLLGHKRTSLPSASDDDQSTTEDDSDTVQFPEQNLPEDWQYQEDEDDVSSTASAASDFSIGLATIGSSKEVHCARGLPILIEDSEWDDAEILD